MYCTPIQQTVTNSTTAALVGKLFPKTDSVDTHSNNIFKFIN